MTSKNLQIGILLFPEVTQLDLTGPAEVFSASQCCDVHLIWKALDPVMTGSGWSINPTHTFHTTPALDVICVPGGTGQIELMDDDETLNFIREQAAHALLVTSVCTGSLILGAAGLLTGYQATSHWMSLDQLELFGAIPVKERVVHDRNRITGAGVSSGIDFALYVLKDLLGDDIAQEVQLGIEYDPAPPFSFSKLAVPSRLDKLAQRAQQRQTRRLRATRKAAERLK
ncbi:DJ-1/PfpI family protein [Celerinatantimonas diazotrophica]|uniref:Cyclohexyl-isocyanide hydratase n=1 Tax=Celerinatantimonas diazotrophica TaxID=412034 RepID=A0A4R1J9P9_9GAMM|nr:DJ-1/PfpI family protein [Celerinatantimonas diazotrophica]TCK47346.1 cyclohexyl-isocyanide hydratase [Celerinatantimonas diazotrophica]CAG9295038.1 Isonitrile hydratase [Celerinatantimonas diazotrophica]